MRGLVERGVHLGVADADRNTLLHAALAAKREETALALVDAGAVDDARAANAQGAPPGSLCQIHGLHAVNRRLRPSPGDHEARSGALSPLNRAARDGDGAAVQRLLDARADVKARSARERCTALSLAAEGGHAALVRLLVAAGADVNAASGTTPHPASGASKYPCVFFADW